ncbi:methanogenesis marker radical SAM protein [Methanosarcinales archaeon]|nr:MAG: methanogenesis marker radical SAM protein [Methanosarcinales archaeon]
MSDELGVSELFEITADIGGRPGVDCRGFCKYCYFKRVKENPVLGCRYCLRENVGCDKCRYEIVEKHNGYADPTILQHYVISRTTQERFANPNRSYAINISGGGDAGCYPDLLELVRSIGGVAPIHLGYVSGKGLTPQDAMELVEAGVRIVTFTVFSTDPLLRREWLNDHAPEAALESLRTFAGNCETYAAAVIIPGVNAEDIFKTARTLESWSVKGLTLMRFGNNEENGIILGNEPIIEGITPQSVEEFRELVLAVDRAVPGMRVVGTPLFDPLTGAPFALASVSEDDFPDFSPIRSEATILTGKVAAPFIERILQRIDGSQHVNVISLEKEIGDLITHRDLERLPLDCVKETVVVPGNALIHNRVGRDLLSRDGVKRYLVRGPSRLTADCETSIRMDREGVIRLEVDGFTELIQMINAFGLPPKE